MNNKSWYGSVSVKIGLFVGIVILAFGGTAIYRETVNKKQIQSEINRLKEEADRMSKKNSAIQDKIAYFQSRDYMEMEAKDKLNLKSSDEQVIIVKPSMAVKEVPVVPAMPTERPIAKVVIANHLKWWNYFFKY